MDQNHRTVRLLEEIKHLLGQQKNVLNVEDLSGYTGLSKSKIYKLTRLKLIPMGNNPHIRQKYFDKQAIDHWLLGEPDLSDETLENRFDQQLLKMCHCWHNDNLAFAPDGHKRKKRHEKNSKDSIQELGLRQEEDKSEGPGLQPHPE